MDTAEGSQQAAKGKRISLLNDVYVDFLGSLVPGLFFVFLGSAALAWPGKALCESFCIWQNLSMAESESQSVLRIWNEIGLGPYGAAAAALVLAYIFGAMFYRQDPKVPDHVSARLVWRKTKSKEDRERLAVQPTSSQADDVAWHDAQFPYYFLYEYLEGRGLKHLAKWVPWRGKETTTWKYRTKMFINILKIRLQFCIPDRCKDIVRNEAHVRMSTSLWYTTKWLMATAGIGLCIALVAFWLGRNSKLHAYSSIQSGIIAGLVLLIASLIKRKIENFIHYLRVRETVYVLETADFATRNGIHLSHQDFTEVDEGGE